jgi:hypothetical protein
VVRAVVGRSHRAKSSPKRYALTFRHGASLAVNGRPYR